MGMACLVALAGCAETRYVTGKGHLDKSGFLGKGLYEELIPGDESQHEPAFRWRDENVAYKQYTKLIIDPVILYRQPHHLGGGNTNENSQLLIDYFHAKLVEEMSRYATIVSRPAPGAARIQVAVTDYDETWVAMDMISALQPIARVVVEVQALGTEKPAFVGGAQIEFKFLDSETGRVMIAGIDRRVGGKTLGKGFSRWADVHAAMDYWAIQGSYRFCMLTGQPNCARPKFGIMGTLGAETQK
jgi:hypothetical protein